MGIDLKAINEKYNTQLINVNRDVLERCLLFEFQDYKYELWLTDDIDIITIGCGYEFGYSKYSTMFESRAKTRDEAITELFLNNSDNELFQRIIKFLYLTDDYLTDD